MRKKFLILLFSGILSLGLFFSFNNFALGQTLSGVLKISPQDGATVSLVPNLSWNSVSGANAYDIEINEARTGNNVWLVFVSGTSVRVSAGVLAGGKTYEWCVRAFEVIPDEDLEAGKTYTLSEFEQQFEILRQSPYCGPNSTWGTITRGEYDDFRTEGAEMAELGTPTKLSPSGQTTFPVVLKWDKVPYLDGYAEGYDWRISGKDEKGEFISGLPEGKTNNNQVEISSSVLSIKASYTFRVRACVSNYTRCGNYAYSNFTVTLQNFHLLSPKNNSYTATEVILDWEDVPGAESYDWVVEGFDSGTVSSSQSAKKISGLTVERTYGPWYVIARREGKDFKSEETTWKFTPKAGVPPPEEVVPPPEEGELPEVPPGAPARPTNLSPCNQSGISTTPTLSWSDVGANVYYVYISSYSIPITTFKTSVKIDPVDLGIILNSGTVYTWYVKACNDTDKCSQSKSCSFTTKGAPAPGEPGAPGAGVRITGGFVCPKDVDKCPDGAVCIENPLCAETFDQLVNAIIGFIFWIAIAVAPIMFLIGGFYLVTAGGDPNRVATARKIMIYTAIGLAIVLLARGLVSILSNLIFGG